MKERNMAARPIPTGTDPAADALAQNAWIYEQTTQMSVDNNLNTFRLAALGKQDEQTKTVYHAMVNQSRLG